MKDYFLHLLRDIQLSHNAFYNAGNVNNISDFVVEKSTLQLLAKEKKDLTLLRLTEDHNLVGFEKEGDEGFPYVYFNPEDRARIDKFYPLRELEESNITLFLNIISAVGKFQHLCHLLENDMPMQQLHLIMQNEIDKYILSFLTVSRRDSEFSMPEVIAAKLLYPQFNSIAGKEARSEPKDALQFAYQYIRHLHQTYLRRNDVSGVESEIQNFYARTQSEKISLINAC